MPLSVIDQLFERIEKLEANNVHLAETTQRVLDRINQPCPDDTVLSQAVARLTDIDTTTDAYIETLDNAAPPES